ncbi:unnamed protein product [Tilletia controversa]|nr:unnamed protein product [Tilletia controversa]
MVNSVPSTVRADGGSTVQAVSVSADGTPLMAVGVGAGSAGVVVSRKEPAAARVPHRNEAQADLGGRGNEVVLLSPGSAALFGP